MKTYIVEAKRTAIGRSHPEKGIFKNVRADEMLSSLMRDFCPRLVPTDKIDDIYIGCVGQHLEQGKNIARLSALLAGFPDSVPGTTINRLCASSLSAFNFAASTIQTRHADLILAGGVEHMTHVPMTAALDYNKELLARYEFPFTNMGLTAEKVAELYEVTRKDQDEFSLHSHQRAALAQKRGDFAHEIVPLTVGTEHISSDQCPRSDTSLEKLAELKPSFSERGTVTAGNSSAISDGASLTLVASEDACRHLNLKKRARIVDYVVVGLNPLVMGMGPLPAVEKLLHRNKLRADQIDIYELNEAFASQAIACMRELKLSPEKVNLNGGAIALGHPLGATGTRLVTTLLHNLERDQKRLGVVAMCIGHGQGIATLIEKVEN